MIEMFLISILEIFLKDHETIAGV